jgi:hypothetical protein
VTIYLSGGSLFRFNSVCCKYPRIAE